MPASPHPLAPFSHPHSCLSVASGGRDRGLVHLFRPDPVPWELHSECLLVGQRVMVIQEAGRHHEGWPDCNRNRRKSN